MKNTNTLLLAFVFCCITYTGLYAQDIICPSIDCGNFNVNFNNSGTVVFCEGSTITLTNESAPGFDFFIIEWGDGAIDTLYNYGDAMHQYDIPDSLVCQTQQSSFSVEFTGITICANGNSCQSGSYTFGIKPEPYADFTVNNTICVNTPFSPSDESCHADDYLWDFGDDTASTDPNPSHVYDTPGTYTITQSVSNTCGTDVTTRTVTVVGEPEAGFIPGDLTICANSTVDFTDQANQYSNTIWDISPVGDALWCFTDTLMSLSTDDISVIFKTPGMYTVTQTASNVCGNDEAEITITVEEAPVVNLSAPPPACGQQAVTAASLNFSVVGAYNDISWEFVNGTPSTGSGEDPGTITFTQSGTVHLVVEGNCGTLNRSVDVTVNQHTAISIPQPPDFCAGSSPDTLAAMPGGGSWSGTGVSQDGVFNPSVGPGTYTLIYALNNPPCNDEQQITVTVLPSETVNTPDRTFCEDSPAATLVATPGGGSWSGTGISDTAGVFDPAIGADIYNPTYTYIDANGCEVVSSPTITVEALPQLMLADTVSLCLSAEDIDLPDIANLSANPSSGGSFSWAGQGIVNADGTFNSGANGLSEGFYPLTVTYTRNQCVVSDSLVVELTTDELLVIAPVAPVCISQDTLQLSANLPGGAWSGPGVSEDSGVVNLISAGGGDHTYTYIYAAGTSCEQTASINVKIIDLEQIVSAGNDTSACEGPSTFTLGGASPVGGAWSGPGIIDSDAGTINLTAMMPGPYAYNYCIESSEVAGCTACDTKIFTYNPKPQAGFSFDGTPCIDTDFTLLPDQPGLLYDWGFGDGDTSTAEMPMHSYPDSGTYTLTQIIHTPEGCADTTSQQLYITNPPTADFELEEDEGCAPFNLELQNFSYGDNISQQWCINGDTIPGGAPPVYVFDSLTDDTVFPIVLKVTNLCGTRVDSASVLVHPYPIVNFGIGEDEGCSPFTAGLNNITLGNPDEYLWMLGPDSVSTEFEPGLPLFTTPDDSVSVYTIQLIARNECGEDSLSKDITVYPPDIEAFIEMDTLEGCQPFTVSPESFSTPGSVLSWEVYGPNGLLLTGAGDEMKPEFELPDPGWYTIILYAERCGQDADTARVYVLPAPELSFSHVPGVCLGDTILFQNSSVQVGGSSWDFGDGNSSTGFSPAHIYDTAGVFTVTYTALSLINNCPATDSSEVLVYGLPQSAFTPEITAGCPPLEAAFENQSSGVGNLSFNWYFGDGSAPSLQSEPIHVFEQTGVYQVKLVVFDEAGCFSDTATAMATVYPKPTSAFSLSQEDLCLWYDTLFVTDLSIDGDILEWAIAGQSYSGANPVAIPVAAGQYTAMQFVSNTFGCRDSSEQAFTVLPSPVAAFSPLPAAICANSSIHFQNQSLFSDSYLWDFGNGTGSTAESPMLTYEEVGPFTVTLTAASSNGCPDSVLSIPVTAHPNPTASFTIGRPFVCGAPLEATFVNTSTLNLENQWAFGDGNTSSALNPVHVYESSGTYAVGLVVITDFGCRDTATQLIDVYGQPVAEASASHRLACSGTEITFTAKPTDALSYEWYLLPSLQPDTGLSITYQLTEPGTYDVRLVAKYNEICQDTLNWFNAITVFTRPTAAFDYIADELENVIGDVRFINSSENAADFFWNLGDGTSSTEFEPEHEYDINRDVEVTLIASTTNGGQFFCADTLKRLIEPEWIVSFEVPNAMSPDYGGPSVREFGAVGSGVEEYRLDVYSPFGALIWSTDALDEGHPIGRWDGTYQDKPVPQGAYTWKAYVRFVNGEAFNRKGTVTVLR